MLYVNKMKQSDYVSAYQIMKQQNFPQLPPSFTQAVFYFNKAHLLGVFKKNQLIACVLFFKTDEGAYCVDGVCHENYHGKWATRKVLRDILTYAFNTLKADFLWTESSRFQAQNFTKKIGFKHVCTTKFGQLCMLMPTHIKKGLL